MGGQQYEAFAQESVCVDIFGCATRHSQTTVNPVASYLNLEVTLHSRSLFVRYLQSAWKAEVLWRMPGETFQGGHTIFLEDLLERSALVH